MQPSRLVVIGGGFTGVMAVVHAIRSSTGPLAVTIVEPARELGRGAAYGTDDPVHRINVPSARMGVFEADPEGATRWLFDKGHLPDSGSEDASGRFYVPRHLYGAFTRDLLRETLLGAGTRVAFEHRVAAATTVARAADGWRVTTSDGPCLVADRVALCHGHAAPAPPCPIDAASRAHPKFVANPWRPDALAPIAAADTVLVVGTGLTMADVVASLRARGHRGAITAISRRGLLPRGQGAFLTTLDLLEGEPAPTTALGLVRLIRRGLRRHGPEHGWQPVLDSARAAFPVLWTALPADERRAIARHALPLWEVHRFRLAPQIEAALAEAMETRGPADRRPPGGGARAARRARFRARRRRREPRPRSRRSPLAEPSRARPDDPRELRRDDRGARHRPPSRADRGGGVRARARQLAIDSVTVPVRR